MISAEEIIASGILEAYATGSLPREEAQQVEAWCATDARVATELKKIEATLENYAYLHAIIPPASLKGKIEHQLQFAESAAPMPVRLQPLYPLAAAAALVLAILMAGVAYYYKDLYHQKYNEVLAMRQKETTLASEVKLLEIAKQNATVQMQIMSDTARMAVKLMGLPIAPMAKAIVYWKPETGETFVNSNYLPPTEDTKQYQVWAIVNGKPVDLGVLDKNTTFQKVNSVMNVQAFAITLEPMGGLPSPTLEMMYVMAKVGA